ncbi:transcriptional regulator, HxlR family [Streptomyces sp. KS_5]|nr:transcriptional regulator, HxlR family [Streptomyces sp. KS_5]
MKNMALGRDYATQACEIAHALTVVGERWTLLILRDAFYGVTRFNDFQTHLGMSRSVLAERLQKLEHAGISLRRPYQTAPPRHEYMLTQRGIDLWPVLLTLHEWGSERTPQGQRLHFYRHASCQSQLGPYGQCQTCGPVAPQDVEVVPGEGVTQNPADPVSRALLKPHRLLTPLSPAAAEA